MDIVGIRTDDDIINLPQQRSKQGQQELVDMAIFVSYCSVDQKSVKPLLGLLAKLKREVFIEAKSVTGEVAWSLIFDTIQACDVFILVLTPHTLLSDARRLEYQYACALNKPVLVIAIEAIPDNIAQDGKLAYIDVSQTLDLRHLDENSETALTEALANLPPADPTPSFAPDWMPSLNALKQQVQQPRIPFKEQSKLVLNLREFLERKESTNTAGSLLKILSKHSGRSIDSEDQITRILEDMESVDHKSHSGLNRMHVAIVVIALFALATLGIIIVRGFPSLNSQSTSAITPTSLDTSATSPIDTLTVRPTTAP